MSTATKTKTGTYLKTATEYSEPLLIENQGDCWFVGSPWQTWERGYFEYPPEEYLERETSPITAHEVALLTVKGGAGRLVESIDFDAWANERTFVPSYRESMGATTVKEWLRELVPECRRDGWEPTVTPYEPGVSVVVFRHPEKEGGLAYLVPDTALDEAQIPRA